MKITLCKYSFTTLRVKLYVPIFEISPKITCVFLNYWFNFTWSWNYSNTPFVGKIKSVRLNGKNRLYGLVRLLRLRKTCCEYGEVERRTLSGNETVNQRTNPWRTEEPKQVNSKFLCKKEQTLWLRYRRPINQPIKIHLYSEAKCRSLIY